MVSLRPGWVTEWHLASEAEMGAEELAQQLKVLGKLPKDQSSVPNTHVRHFTRSYRHRSGLCKHWHTKWNLFFKWQCKGKQTKSLGSLAFQPEAWLLSTHLIFHRGETFYLPSTREYPLWLAIACHQTQQVPSHWEEIEYKEITRLWMGG